MMHMAVKDFDFVKYDPKQMEHIRRHVESDVAGSCFARGAFPDIETLIDYAYEEIADEYNGTVLTKHVDTGRIIGYDALVRLDLLPEGVTILLEPRGPTEFRAYVVSGVRKKETSQLAIIAGPLESGLHGFYSIYPGSIAPPFPLSEEELRERGFAGENLEKALQENKNYAEFWSRHGFAKD